MFRTTVFVCIVTGFLSFPFSLAPSAPLLAAKDQDGWQTIRVRPAASNELVDLRAIAFEHEVAVALEEPWEIGGHELTFALDRRGQLTVAHRTPRMDPERSPRPRPVRRLPGLIELRDLFETNYAISVRYEKASETVYLASAYGFPVRLGRQEAFVVDSALNGELGSEGDGILVPSTGTLAPYGDGEIWSRQAAVQIRRDDDGRWQQRDIKMPRPGNRDHSEAWRLVQWWRQATGLLPIEAYDDSLEQGLVEHAEYQARNDTSGHDQDPSLPGATPEGARAAGDSVLGYEKSSYIEAIIDQLQTAYHRNSVLSPGLRKTAMKLHNGYFGMRIHAHNEGPLRGLTAYFPPHGMEGVNAAFNPPGERPMPADRHFRDHGLGLTVTIWSRNWSHVSSGFDDVEVNIYPAGRNEPVRAYVFAPGNPPPGQSRSSNSGSITATAASPLRTNSEYRVVAAYTFQGERIERTWSFRTGGTTIPR